MSVVEDIVDDMLIGGSVALHECLPGPRCAVELGVGHLDPVVGQETEGVRGNVEGQYGEVDEVVVVEKVDPQTGTVHLLVLHP